MDRELAAALAGELPAAANARIDEALPVSLACPLGSTGARYQLDGGHLSVIMTQPDALLPSWQLPSGSVRAEAPTSAGQTVVVVGEPDIEGDAPPFGEDVRRIATELANAY